MLFYRFDRQCAQPRSAGVCGHPAVVFFPDGCSCPAYKLDSTLQQPQQRHTYRPEGREREGKKERKEKRKKKGKRKKKSGRLLLRMCYGNPGGMNLKHFDPLNRYLYVVRGRKEEKKKKHNNTRTRVLNTRMSPFPWTAHVEPLSQIPLGVRSRPDRVMAYEFFNDMSDVHEHLYTWHTSRQCS